MKFFQSAFIIIAVAATITSCEKQHLTAPASVPVVPPVAPPPASNLEAVLKFNGDLLDSSAKLHTNGILGISAYGTDRKGNANGALYLDGACGITMQGLNMKGKSMTMTAWIKYESTGFIQFIAIAVNDKGGMALTQSATAIGTSISIPNTNSVFNSVDANWHHLASTYDGTTMKIYIDGVLSKTKEHVGDMGDGTKELNLGYYASTFWKGYVDDLRIYNTVLTEDEIKNVMAL